MPVEADHSGNITFPFGYPFQKATDVSFNTILGELEKIKHLQKIRFVPFSEQNLRFYEDKLEKIK